MLSYAQRLFLHLVLQKAKIYYNSKAQAKLYYDDIYRNNDKCVIINGEQSMTTIVEKIKHILEDKDERFRD